MTEKKDIEDLEKKIEAFKKQKEKGSTILSIHAVQGSSRGFLLSVDLIVSVFTGVAIGYFLDIVFSTAPWFLVIFTVFGGAAGILNVYRSAKRQED